MAMNKKEKAEFDAAKKAVFVARALNWTQPVYPDVPVPKSGETTGYLFNAYNCRVMFARSSTIGHASSDEDMPTKTSRQGCRALYSTRLLALQALRHELEKEYANTLAAIDMQIQKESA